MVALDDALVVGGGVGGMSAAIALARHGLHVELVEIDPTWRAVGAGLTLNGATFRALRELGVLDQVVAEGFGSTGTSVSCSADGTIVSPSVDMRPFGPDIPVIGGILRPVLHKILQEACATAGVRVRTGLSVAKLERDGERVQVAFSDASRADYGLVVGADGLYSTTRQMVFPDAPKPRFTGQGCWRAVVPRPPEVTTPYVFLNGDRKAGFNPVSADEMYLYLLVSVPGNRWMATERWPELLHEELQGFGGYIATIREGLNATSRINYRPLEALLLPSPWYNGRVLLIGDAAHATTPHVGYGAGLAIEDGVILGELVQREVSAETMLQHFMERRFERCRAVVEGSVALGDLEISGGPPEAHHAAMAKLMEVVRAPL